MFLRQPMIVVVRAELYWVHSTVLNTFIRRVIMKQKISLQIASFDTFWFGMVIIVVVKSELYWVHSAVFNTFQIQWRYSVLLYSFGGIGKQQNINLQYFVIIIFLLTSRKPSTHESRSWTRKTGSVSPENSKLVTNSPDWMHSRLVGTTMKRAL